MSTHHYISTISNIDTFTISLSGDWVVMSLDSIERELKSLHIPLNRDIVIDVSSVKEFDTAGILLFIDKFASLLDTDRAKVIGYSLKQEDMYQLLIKSPFEDIKHPKENIFSDIGKYMVSLFNDIIAFLAFLGELAFTILHTIIHPKSFRIKEVVYHIRHSGFDALLIIAMTSFLVGMVIAYQGAVELSKFGADIYIVDTVAISIVRELGPMITAIVIAGRSGSAYTAEIGAMKITEEISAMRTMGFDPFAFLVLPRVIALMISLPLLIFFSDIVGIWGGMIASTMELHLSATQFIDRLYEVLELKHYILGMIKGPVFAFVIASIGCFRGLMVSDNTESIGLQTTSSVVNSIFLVIAFDALFSVIYTELGL
jgi:phospholipid/cholesterol/gamma-HCH transport system permease protein